MRYILLLMLVCSTINAQFGNIEVTVDDRLLRNSERQKISSIKNEVSRFFSRHKWSEEFQELKIPLYISIAFQGVAQKGGIETFHAQVLFSDGMDIRYFDKSLQFHYNSGSSIQFDPVIFEPLGSFLAFYAYMSLAGHLDTYDFYGGNRSFDQAREIALRGMASDYPKGWANRVQLLKEVTGNKGLREARFAYYVAIDLLKDGRPDEALKEFELMIKGLDVVFRQFPTGRTLYFLNANHIKISNKLNLLGQETMLLKLSEMDPANRKGYIRGLKND